MCCISKTIERKHETAMAFPDDDNLKHSVYMINPNGNMKNVLVGLKKIDSGKEC